MGVRQSAAGSCWASCSWALAPGLCWIPIRMVSTKLVWDAVLKALAGSTHERHLEPSRRGQMELRQALPGGVAGRRWVEVIAPPSSILKAEDLKMPDEKPPEPASSILGKAYGRLYAARPADPRYRPRPRGEPAGRVRRVGGAADHDRGDRGLSTDTPGGGRGGGDGEPGDLGAQSDVPPGGARWACAAPPDLPGTPRGERPRQGFFEHGEYEAVRRALPGPYQDVLDFAYYSGWRKREILGLRWGEVDDVGGVVRLSPVRAKTRVGGASAINCWRPVPNSPTCYSLGRHLNATVLSSTGPTHREETTLSQSHVFLPRKRRVHTHHPLRILPNHGRKTASLPVRGVRTDVLDDKGHALLPAPASQSDI